MICKAEQINMKNCNMLCILQFYNLFLKEFNRSFSHNPRAGRMERNLEFTYYYFVLAGVVGCWLIEEDGCLFPQIFPFRS